jgi:hypothetical protein
MHRVELKPTIPVFKGDKTFDALKCIATMAGDHPNQNLKCQPTVTANQTLPQLRRLVEEI